MIPADWQIVRLGDLGRVVRGGSPRLAQMTMFSSDYPHSVTLWPDSREHIERLTRDLSDEDRHAVLAGNAARVYGFEVE